MAGLLLNISGGAVAAGQPLQLSTNTLVDDEGRVRIHLTLRNSGREPIHDLLPMFHFHHKMVMMNKIVRLDPGQGITLENTDHPPVLRTGRYPLVVMAKYKIGDKAAHTQIHTDSFYFREPVESVIDGEIRTILQGDGSLVQVLLRNNSSSFKNVRLMLLLPPGLVADKFSKMMGFTIRGGEEKIFTVPVRRVEGSADAIYPVHLMIEYAEMLKHYTGEIGGEIDFRSAWDRAALLPSMTAIGVLMLVIYCAYRKRQTSFPTLE
ncbi:MAG: hypothetical protein IID13_00205 [Candidatus Marinimicrobia bacterium]|nr:hypothetical protein [Candidatus Neomarinimicrobiota bacterium]